MNTKKIKIIVLLTAFVFVFLSGCGQKLLAPGPASPASPVPSVTRGLSLPLPGETAIIYTSGLDGNALLPVFGGFSRSYPQYHFSQIQEIIRRLSSGRKIPVLLLDAGGSLLGSDDFSRFFGGEPMAELMGAAGYHGALVEPGIELSPKKFPFLVPGSPRPGYREVDLAGRRVVIFSLYAPGGQPDRDTHPVLGLEAVVREKGGDFNVLLYHGGGLEFVASRARGINLIIPGTRDNRLNTGSITVINGIPVAPWVDSRYNLGMVEIDGGTLKARVIPGAGAEPAIPKKFMKVLKPYIARFRKVYGGNYRQILRRAVAFGVDGVTNPGSNREESPAGSYTADTIRLATGADVALINRQAVREGFEGFITPMDVRRALPFENKVVTMNLSGKQLLEILHSMADEKGPFYHVSGIAMAVDSRHRKVLVYFNGKPLEKERLYRVAVVDYLADSDKDKYKVFGQGTNRRDTGLVLNHLTGDRMVRYPLVLPPVSRLVYADGFLDEALTRLTRKGAPDFLSSPPVTGISPGSGY